MKKLIFWLMNHNRHWVIEWLYSNQREVESAYDYLISTAIADFPKAQGYVTLPFYDDAGELIGELDVMTCSIVDYLDYGRRRTSKGRYSFNLECYYQWLYRYEPNSSTVVAPENIRNLLAEQICEAEGTIRYIARCRKCLAKDPKISIVFGEQVSPDYNFGGVISCSCGAVFYKYESKIKFILG